MKIGNQEPIVMEEMGKLNKAKNITQGIAKVITGKKYRHTDARIRTCRTCDSNTWLKKTEYAGWLLKNGIKVLTHLEDLTVLPDLPKGTEGKNLYCRLCKCFIPAKARVENETCPLNKWAN